MSDPKYPVDKIEKEAEELIGKYAARMKDLASEIIGENKTIYCY